MDNLVGTAFAEALQDAGEPPCTEGARCSYYSQCAAGPLCCADFVQYVWFQELKWPYARQSIKDAANAKPSRVPSRFLYDVCYERSGGRKKRAEVKLRKCRGCGSKKDKATGFTMSERWCNDCVKRDSTKSAVA